jgi:hypothetical protein
MFEYRIAISNRGVSVVPKASMQHMREIAGDKFRISIMIKKVDKHKVNNIFGYNVSATLLFLSLSRFFFFIKSLQVESLVQILIFSKRKMYFCIAKEKM